MKKTLLFIVLIISTLSLSAQQDEQMIRQIYNEALTSDVIHHQLKWLCENTEGRISGRPEAAKAVDYTYQEMLNMNLDRVYLQPCMVKAWKRGQPEKAFIISGKQQFEVPVSALGLSIGTGSSGLHAEIVEVYDFEDLKELGREQIEGKIVFFNKPMEPTLVNTFAAYGGAAGWRVNGAAEAAKYGAVGVVVRSLTLAKDDFPHTGVMHYEEGVEQIPAVMISTNGADFLSEQIKKEEGLQFYFQTSCYTEADVVSHNVIGEIKGSTYPDRIITIGGHLDAWDNGQGAHDDAGGCVQSMEVLRIFKALGIRPNYTIRAVMFMDEEIAQRGGQKYAEQANANQEKHLMAFEQDRGVLVPRAIAFSTFDPENEKHQNFKALLKPYNIEVVKGGGGVDIGPLKQFYPDIVFGDLITDDQRYFDFHHSGNDSFDQVNKRELQLGAAAIASLIYLIDQHGIE